MPQLRWRWNCTCDVMMGVLTSGPDACTHCGKLTSPDGWARGSIEEMAQYQRIHGLKALGPHRKLADELFRGLRSRCESCGGSGFVGTESWGYCRVCEGTGGFWAADESYLVAAYRVVVFRYPAAAASGALSSQGVFLE